MGCNRLIAANLAGLVRSAADLCEAMSWPMREASAAASQQPTLPMPLNPDEELIVNYLAENEDASLSSITAATGFAVGKLMSMLIDMEFRGLLLALPGARYRKV
jgi:DNA processing protein